ncbi:MAG: exonuclease [Idiomarina sp.]|jgi:inhibitor of KinA sporulation pathway (predicted exonuclease)|uniref:EXOIII family exonuclease n=1 Tax=Idiomarina loihiensis (strain ATCC BAA-735 / DSM 15497 / L2-TR) TaxID=283942 RepID=Q5QYM0_IDILO|nr:EXOIII family exonuclease [Idiomarina loihiensis L2TR]MAA63053.1 exonuclease [Idiomarina sp.]
MDPSIVNSNRLYLIVDLEATCWDGNVEGLDRKQTVDDMEIIEFGCVIAEDNGTVRDYRSFMVRPQSHPNLSEFCTQLTSIAQSDVDAAPVYQSVVPEIDQWLKNYKLEGWGSWGNYDKNQISAEQRRHNLAPEFFSLSHMNIKQEWRRGKVNSRSADLANAMKYHGLSFEGTHHRGIDDALNIAPLLRFTDL